MEFEWPVLLVSMLNVFLPIIVQFFKQKIPSYAGRYLLAIALSGVTALLGIILQGQWDGANIAGMFMLAIVVGQSAYALFWHKLLNGGR